MVTTTRAQRKALWEIFKQDFLNYQTPTLRRFTGGYWNDGRNYTRKMPSIQYRKFRKQVQPSFDGSGCVMVPWKGMWLGIEKDGCTHS